MKFRNGIRQTQTLFKPKKLLTLNEKIDDLDKLKHQAKASPDASSPKAVILAGLEGEDLSVYRHQVITRHGHQQLVFNTVIYSPGINSDSIKFNEFQTLTLFQRILRLPFGDRLLTGLSSHDVINSEAFFNRMNHR